MNILIVHEVSYRKKVVYEYQDFAERLAARGHNVHVIEFDEEGSGEKFFGKVSKTGLAEVTLESTPFINIPYLKYFSGRLNYYNSIKNRLKDKLFDVVFLYSVFISGTNTVRLCRRYKIPVIYRVLDAYHLVRQNSLYKIPLYYGEKYIYRNANLVCTTNDVMNEYVVSIAGEEVRKNCVPLYHGVDKNHFKRIEPEQELRKKYGINIGDPVLIFLGTLYSFSGLDVVIKNFSSVLSEHPSAKMLIVGKGEQAEQLESLVKEYHLENNIYLTGVKAYAELPALLSLGSIGLTPFFINDITRNIIPIKNLQYLSTGLAVVSAPIIDVKRLFPETESGTVYCSIEEEEKFAESIIQLLSNPSKLHSLQANARSFIEKHFDIEVQISKLEQIFTSTLNQ